MIIDLDNKIFYEKTDTIINNNYYISLFSYYISGYASGSSSINNPTGAFSGSLSINPVDSGIFSGYISGYYCDFKPMDGNLCGNISGFISGYTGNSGLFSGNISGHSSGLISGTISDFENSDNIISGIISGNNSTNDFINNSSGIGIISGFINGYTENSDIFSGYATGHYYDQIFINNLSGIISGDVFGFISGHTGNSGLFSGSISGNTSAYVYGIIDSFSTSGLLSGYSFGHINGTDSNFIFKNPDNIISGIISGIMFGNISNIVSGTISGNSQELSGSSSNNLSSGMFSGSLPFLSGGVIGSITYIFGTGNNCEMLQNIVNFYSGRASNIDDNYWLYYYDRLKLQNAGLDYLDLKDFLKTGSLNIVYSIIQNATSGISGFDLSNCSGNVSGLNEEILTNIFSQINIAFNKEPYPTFTNTRSGVLPGLIDPSPPCLFCGGGNFSNPGGLPPGLTTNMTSTVADYGECGNGYQLEFPRNPVALWTFRVVEEERGTYGPLNEDGTINYVLNRPYTISKVYLGDLNGNYFFQSVAESTLFVEHPRDISKIEPGYWYSTDTDPYCLFPNSNNYPLLRNWTRGGIYDYSSITKNENVYAIPGPPKKDAVIKNSNEAVGDNLNQFFTSVDWLSYSDELPSLPPIGKKVSRIGNGIRLWNNLMAYSYRKYEDFKVGGDKVLSISPHRYTQSPKRLVIKQSLLNTPKMKQNGEFTLALWVKRQEEWSDEFGYSIPNYLKSIGLVNNRIFIGKVGLADANSYGSDDETYCYWDPVENERVCTHSSINLVNGCNGAKIGDYEAVTQSGESPSDTYSERTQVPYQGLTYSSYPKYPGGAQFPSNVVLFQYGFKQNGLVRDTTLYTFPLTTGGNIAYNDNGIYSAGYNHPDFQGLRYFYPYYGQVDSPPLKMPYGYAYNRIPRGLESGAAPSGFEMQYQQMHTDTYNIPGVAPRNVYLHFDFGGGTFPIIITGNGPWWGNFGSLGQPTVIGSELWFQKAFDVNNEWDIWDANVGDFIGPNGITDEDDEDANCVVVEKDNIKTVVICGDCGRGELQRIKLKVEVNNGGSSETVYDDFFAGGGIIPLNFPPGFNRSITVTVNENNQILNRPSYNIRFGKFKEHGILYGYKNPRLLDTNWAYYIGETCNENIMGKLIHSASLTTGTMHQLSDHKLPKTNWTPVTQLYADIVNPTNDGQFNVNSEYLPWHYRTENLWGYEFDDGYEEKEFIDLPKRKALNYIAGSRINEASGISFFEYRGGKTTNNGSGAYSTTLESGVGFSFGGHVVKISDFNLDPKTWHHIAISHLRIEEGQSFMNGDGNFEQADQEMNIASFYIDGQLKSQNDFGPIADGGRKFIKNVFRKSNHFTLNGVPSFGINNLYNENITCNKNDFFYDGGGDYSFNQLAVWDRPLGSCEIEALFNKRAGVAPSLSAAKYQGREYDYLNVTSSPSNSTPLPFYKVNWLGYNFNVSGLDSDEAFLINGKEARDEEGSDITSEIIDSNGKNKLFGDHPYFYLEYDRFHKHWRVRQHGTNIVFCTSLPVPDSRLLPTYKYSGPMDNNAMCKNLTINEEEDNLENELIGASFGLNRHTKIGYINNVYRKNNPHPQASQVCVAASQNGVVALGVENEDSVYIRGSASQVLRRPDLEAYEFGNIQPSMKFGASVAISSNGLYLAIGAPNANNKAGAVYIYKNDGGFTLKQTFYGDNAGDRFGSSVHFSNDNTRFTYNRYRSDREAAGNMMFFVGAPGKGYGNDGYFKWYNFYLTNPGGYSQNIRLQEVSKIYQPAGWSDFGANITSAPDGSSVYVVSPNNPIGYIDGKRVKGGLPQNSIPSNGGGIFKYDRVAKLGIMPFTGTKYNPIYTTGIVGSYRFFTGISAANSSGVYNEYSPIQTYSGALNLFSGEFSGLIQETPFLFIKQDSGQDLYSGNIPISLQEDVTLLSGIPYYQDQYNNAINTGFIYQNMPSIFNSVINSSMFLVSGISGKYTFYKGISGSFEINVELVNDQPIEYNSSLGVVGFDYELSLGLTTEQNYFPQSMSDPIRLGFGHAIAPAIDKRKNSIYCNITNPPGSVVKIDTSNSRIGLSEDAPAYDDMAGSNYFENFGQSLAINREGGAVGFNILVGKAKLSDKDGIAALYQQTIRGNTEYELSDKFNFQTPDADERFKRLTHSSSVGCGAAFAGYQPVIATCLDPTGGGYSSFEIVVE